jgi:phosphatidylglycerol:prolipoprotein diacylglycerol transferase
MGIEVAFVNPVLVTLHLFGRPMPLYVFGLFMVSAASTIFLIMEYEIKRLNLQVDAGEIMMCLIMGGLGGAKLFWFFDSSSMTMKELTSGQGFSYQGGLIVAFIACSLSVLRQRNARATYIRMADMIFMSLPAALAVGKVGCFLSGDGCYGRKTDLPWGMSFPNGMKPVRHFVHPAPLYEFSSSVAIFVFLWRRRDFAQTHELTYFANIGLGMGRFFVEFVRRSKADSHGLTLHQYVALSQAGAGVLHAALIYHFCATRSKYAEDPSPTGPAAKAIHQEDEKSKKTS